MTDKDSAVRSVFVASDGYRLQARHWAPEQPQPRGWIVALHGIQSHSGWYGRSSRALSRAGYDVTFLDRRGSGLNRLARGYAVHQDRLINDVRTVLQEVCRHRDQLTPEAPVILLGVSWGGRLAAAASLRMPELIHGTALLYPGIIPRRKVTRWESFVLNLVEGRGWGGVSREIPLNDPALFTADPDWQDFIRRDELALQRVSVSFILAGLALSQEVLDNTAKWTTPVLLMLAGQDQIIDNQATRQLFQQWPTTEKQLIEYPDARHTLEFEPPTCPFIDDLLAWLSQRGHRVADSPKA
jgi:acylglycerol lipase